MNHAELIARLEAATRGRRSLGRDILVALEVVREVEPSMFYGIGNEDVWHYGDAAESEGCWQMLPDPTTSLDSALALAERVLPGWVWEIQIDAGGAVVQCDDEWWGEGYVAPDVGGVYADAKTPALSLCIAILRALDAKQEGA